MKIALVSFNTYRPIFPPLGLLYLASYLTKSDVETDVKVFDANFDEDIVETVNEYQPDIIGLTAMTNDYGKAIKFAKAYKKIKDTPILIGGVHITTLPSSLKKCFDIAIMGEGEETFSELVNLYEKEKGFPKEKLRDIAGLGFLENGEFVETEKRPLLQDLDTIPLINRDLLNPKYFEKKTLYDGSKGVYTNMTVSRGCPYGCVFCSTSLFWERRIRFHSNKYIVEEIKELYHKHHVDYINIPDDLFIFKKESLKELIEMLEDEEILGKISFGVQLRVDLVDEELLDLLKELNVIHVGFGLESGSEKILSFLKNRKISVEQAKKAVKMCVDKGFLTSGSLMFAIPGETVEDMNKSLEYMKYLRDIGMNDLSSFVFTPFPGTQMWELAKERGKVSDEMDWESITQNSLGQAKSPLLLDESVSYEEYMDFFKKRGEIMKSFKIKNLKRDLRKHPFMVIKRALGRPQTLVRMLFKRWIY